MNRVNLHNQKAWDDRVRRRLHHTQTATGKVFENPEEMADIHGWVGRDLKGKAVLCLGAGGGRHGPLYAAVGARVTVVDISPEMLKLDHEVAGQRGLTLQTREASMDDLSCLGDDVFDLVVQPVSTCYVPDIVKVYENVARVMVPQGLYLSQHKQPTNLQAGTVFERQGYTVKEPYFQEGPLPEAPAGSLHREPGCLEFIHPWEQLLGGLCRSGFVIEDLLEPRHGDPQADPGSFPHRCEFIPPYVAVKARCVKAGGSGGGLWVP